MTIKKASLVGWGPRKKTPQQTTSALPGGVTSDSNSGITVEKRTFLRRNRESGSLSLETVIITPAIIALLIFAITAGRIAVTKHAVQVVAHNAARAASLTRDAASAQAEATRIANSSIAEQHLQCTSSNVIMKPESGGFSAPTGTTGVVHVTVTCTISLEGMGSKTVTADSYSPIDRYRSE